MSTVDVGDAVELTMEVTTGSTVTASWLNPAGGTVIDAATVTEDPAGSGLYPYTFLPTSAGVWTAVFTAVGVATAVERHYVRALAVDGPAPLATVGDVAALYGTLSSAQTSLVQTLLRHASRLVRIRFTDVDDRIAAGDLDAETAALAVVQMVTRVVRNPTGLRSESVGPFSRTFANNGPVGGLFITDAEVALLAVPVSGPQVPVATIWVCPTMAQPTTAATVVEEGESVVLGW